MKSKYLFGIISGALLLLFGSGFSRLLQAGISSSGLEFIPVALHASSVANYGVDTYSESLPEINPQIIVDALVDQAVPGEEAIEIAAQMNADAPDEPQREDDARAPEVEVPATVPTPSVDLPAETTDNGDPGTNNGNGNGNGQSNGNGGNGNGNGHSNGNSGNGNGNDQSNGGNNNGNSGNGNSGNGNGNGNGNSQGTDKPGKGPNK